MLAFMLNHNTSTSSPSHSSKKPLVGAVALAIALMAGHTSAHALALGRAMIQSNLGEPLVAEIDLPEVTEDEARSLRIGLASPEAYSALGIQFNPALNGLSIAIKRRNDGRTYLDVRSNRPITEPFVELVIQAQWASGKLQREYTFLLDPPKQTPVAPIAAAIEAAAPAAPAAPVVTQPVPAPAPVASAPAPSIAPAPAPAPRKPEPAAPAPATAVDRAADHKVSRGETAGGIAARIKPAGVSLDQMLVAMLKANPDAFIQGNVNRLKAGAIIQMPSAADAQQISPAEARRLIVAQSRDFNEFRRRLAGIAPSAPAAEKSTEISGQVQTEVADRQTQAATEDKLTLSKAAAAEKAAAEVAAQEAIAQQRAAEELAKQTAETTRNVDELNQLQAAVSAAAGASEAPPQNPSEAPAAPAVPAVELAAPPAVAASPVAPPPAPAEPSFIEKWTSHPWALPGAGALLGLLALLGIARMRKREEPAALQESSFLDQTIQPDSSFGHRGTQKIDTAEMPSFQVSVMESPTGASSLMYSPSQLDAAGDVDPVAEADVYLAYGKDIQAEEILNEALRTQPDRLPVRIKLLEIFVRRQDKSAFAEGAKQLKAIAGTQGHEWATVVAWGEQLDPRNSMYVLDHGDDDSVSLPLEPEDAVQETPITAFTTPDTAEQAEDRSNPPSAFDVLDVNLDLDLLDGSQAPVEKDNRITQTMPVEGFAIHPAQTPQAVDIDFGDLDLELKPMTEAGFSVAEPANALASSAGAHQEPLRTKLALAKEFLSIGDATAARAMAQEVLEQGDETLQVEARALLASLG